MAESFFINTGHTSIQWYVTHSGGVILCLSTPWRKVCLSESAAEIRFEGSRVSIRSMRSKGASGMTLHSGRGSTEGSDQSRDYPSHVYIPKSKHSVMLSLQIRHQQWYCESNE